MIKLETVIIILFFIMAFFLSDKSNLSVAYDKRYNIRRDLKYGRYDK